MIRNLLFIVAVIMFSIVSSTEGYSQSKKEIRKREREVADSAAITRVKTQIMAKEFRYVATSIESTGEVRLTNVRLNKLWYIAVTPTTIRCYMPIYGVSSPTSSPSLIKEMDFIQEDYEMTTEETKNGYEVKIKVMDGQTATEYRMIIDIPENGRNARLTILSNFDQAVTFMGNILR